MPSRQKDPQGISIQPNPALGRRASWTSEPPTSLRYFEAPNPAASLEIYADPATEVLATRAAWSIRPSELPLETH